MNDQVLINGVSTGNVSCFNRGLQFGDGLFETLAVIDNKIMQWSLHWQRLILGCKRLSLPLPNEETLLHDITQLCQNRKKCVIKLIYTRGESHRGYYYGDIEPTRIIMFSAWPLFDSRNASEGINVFLCQTQLALQPLLAGIKHLNRLENVMARNEWDSEFFSEGLVCDTNGHIIEGTMSNIFIVKNGEVFTPSLKNCGVAGVTRCQIIENQSKFDVTEGNYFLDFLGNADEVFMCNSLFGIWPVKNLGEYHFSTDNNENPVTRYYQKMINSDV